MGPENDWSKIMGSKREDEAEPAAAATNRGGGLLSFNGTAGAEVVINSSWLAANLAGGLWVVCVVARGGDKKTNIIKTKSQGMWRWSVFITCVSYRYV